MKQAKFEQDIPFNVSELQRLQQWYRSFSTDRNAGLSAADVLLEGKIAFYRTDMEARVVVRSEAVRESYRARQRHVGVERRSRLPVETMVTPRPRMVRYVLSTH